MKKTIATCVVTGLLLMSFDAAAEVKENLDKDKYEKRGALVGMTLGAVAAGPIGAGLGTILGGGLFGKVMDVHKHSSTLKKEHAELKAAYTQTQYQMRRDEANYLAEVSRLQRELVSVRESRSVKLITQVPEVPIQFKTASADLEPHYRKQLVEIAKSLKSQPQMRIFLAGFADRRGDSEYNLTLSEQRVNHVRTFLLAQGVMEDQIEMAAFGEEMPLHAEASFENHFFDRRVVMQIFPAEDSPVAKR